MSKLSIVCPCFNEEDSIDYFYTELIGNINSLDYEIIFVDDGSSDDTLVNIKNLSQDDENIKFISFSRNFGKESAIYAGLELSSGDYVVLIDADLQDPPRFIPQMIDLVETTNYDVIATRRVSRKGEPVVRSFFARLFYRIINKISR